MSEIVLSVLVISHNQRELLPRCLDSILTQELDVPYEVVISDDRSSDGTWELIETYTRQYPEIIRGVKCNSDECDPITRSERCGWNKGTAYRHARGEFFVNIDADDYLRGNDIYQKQLDALRSHPDCSMCQQRVWQVEDGEPIESGYAWPSHPRLKEGAVLGAKEIIRNGLVGLNQTYMIRRHAEEDPVGKYGKWFDDTIITLHHLQYGNVVFIDRADYIWVQYKGSISNSMKNWDKQILYALLPYQHALLIPKFQDLFMTQTNRHIVRLLKQSLFGKIALQETTTQYLRQFKGFIFQFYANGQKGIISRFRLLRALMLYRQIKKGTKGGSEVRSRLYQLLVG